MLALKVLRFRYPKLFFLIGASVGMSPLFLGIGESSCSQSIRSCSQSVPQLSSGFYGGLGVGIGQSGGSVQETLSVPAVPAGDAILRRGSPEAKFNPVLEIFGGYLHFLKQFGFGLEVYGKHSDDVDSFRINDSPVCFGPGSNYQSYRADIRSGLGYGADLLIGVRPQAHHWLYGLLGVCCEQFRVETALQDDSNPAHCDITNESLSSPNRNRRGFAVGFGYARAITNSVRIDFRFRYQFFSPDLVEFTYKNLVAHGPTDPAKPTLRQNQKWDRWAFHVRLSYAF
jgi:hypothetical protein